MEKTNLLPSNCQIGDKVNLNFFESGKINNCEIAAVKFNAPKVYYDVAILVVAGKDGEEAMYTLVEGVDSVFIEKID